MSSHILFYNEYVYKGASLNRTTTTVIIASSFSPSVWSLEKSFSWRVEEQKKSST